MQNHAQTPALAVTCSGGVDSMVLAHALWQVFSSGNSAKTVPRLALFHIDHNQHPRSSQIAREVEQWGKTLGYDVFIEKLNLSPGASEARLRQARYQALHHLWVGWQPSNPTAQIVLAHHRLDQLETILLRLMRGSHPQSLKGMTPHSTRGQLSLWRPFLELSKSDIINYAAHYKLKWWDDPSNRDTRFARNAVRHEILPLLEKIRPRSGEKILQFFSDLQETLRSTQKAQSSVAGETEEWDIATLSWDELQQKVKVWLGDLNQSVKRIHWINLKKAFESGMTDGRRRQLEFPHGRRIEIHRRRLRFFPSIT